MTVSRPAKKVCLITPNHISTNPRLVKEAIALSAAGYRVHIVFTQHVEEQVAADLNILRQHPDWTYQYMNWTGSDRKSKFIRLRNALFYKFIILLGKPPLFSAKIILNRNYLFQLAAAKRSKADLFIAHNAGALAVAGDAAQRTKKKFAFDAEDFHRGELIPASMAAAICRIEDHYLPRASYLSAASPLIAQEYERLYSVQPLPVNNVFSKPADNRALAKQTGNTLRLYWFSQSVGTNRGLQDVIAAMKLAEGLDIEFHIYGKVYKEFQEAYEQQLAGLQFATAPSIYFHGTVSPDDLLHAASGYDIGFAIEPGFCHNNRIALSNKIFTYLLGGNAVIFSETPAQRDFYQQHSEIGFLYQPQDVKKLAQILATYFHDRELLRRHQNNSKALFENEYNWNFVQQSFLRQIEQTFSN